MKNPEFDNMEDKLRSDIPRLIREARMMICRQGTLKCLINYFRNKRLEQIILELERLEGPEEDFDDARFIDVKIRLFSETYNEKR